MHSQVWLRHAERYAKTDFAQSTLSFVLKRIDERHVCFDIRMLPRQLKDITSENMLQLVGWTRKAVTATEQDFPPLCHAHDNHLSHRFLVCMFLGLKRRKFPLSPYCLQMQEPAVYRRACSSWWLAYISLSRLSVSMLVHVYISMYICIRYIFTRTYAYTAIVRSRLGLRPP